MVHHRSLRGGSVARWSPQRLRPPQAVSGSGAVGCHAESAIAARWAGAGAAGAAASKGAMPLRRSVVDDLVRAGRARRLKPCARRARLLRVGRWPRAPRRGLLAKRPAPSRGLLLEVALAEFLFRVTEHTAHGNDVHRERQPGGIIHVRVLHREGLVGVLHQRWPCVLAAAPAAAGRWTRRRSAARRHWRSRSRVASAAAASAAAVASIARLHGCHRRRGLGLGGTAALVHLGTHRLESGVLLVEGGGAPRVPRAPRSRARSFLPAAPWSLITELARPPSTRSRSASSRCSLNLRSSASSLYASALPCWMSSTSTAICHVRLRSVLFSFRSRSSSDTDSRCSRSFICRVYFEVGVWPPCISLRSIVLLTLLARLAQTID